MNRIDRIFADRRAGGRGALMPFVTGGYPSLGATAAILPAMEAAGASICEIGIAFSDPIADGPVIQASMTEALSRGVRPAEVFEVVRHLRPRLDMGLVAMVSYSIVYRAGIERFVADAAAAGFDGFIFPDLPLEEADAVTGPVRAAGMTAALLVAPTTPDDRAEAIARACTGFVYLVGHTGITGERSDLPEGLAKRVARLHAAADLPIAVGFGIASAEQVRAVTRVADAAIVGSALVRRLAEQADAPPERAADTAAQFVAELARGLAGKAGTAG